MPQDAFTLRAEIAELGSLLSGAKINRVSQPDRDDVYLLTYSSLGTKVLVLSSNAENCRISFTESEKPNPKTAPGFCMLLRKHLLGSVLESIELVGSERIAKLTFTGRNDFREKVKKVLYHEIMGKYSNLILTENGKILGCLKNAPLDVATTRLTLAGADYVLPKSQDKADILNKQEAISRLSAYREGVDLARFLFENIKGLSFPTANELASRLEGKSSAEELYEGAQAFLLSPNLYPNVAGEGKQRDFYVTDYRTIAGVKRHFDSVWQGEMNFFDNKEKNKAFLLRQTSLLGKANGLIRKLTKKLQGETEKILQAGDAETLRLKGELLTANLYRVLKGVSEVTLENYYDGYKPIAIALDKNLTPNANAQRYFRKYAKEKRTLEILVPQKEQTEKELAYLKSVLLEINRAGDIEDFKDIEDEMISAGILPAPKFRKKETTESPYRVYRAEGYLIRCGKNNIQNDKLTGRAFKDDLWLHTKDYHSAHVIVETKGEPIPDRVTEIAAEICAYYSDAQSGTKVPVDYTLKKFVKKPPQAKPGSVIYTDYKTCYVTPCAHEEFAETSDIRKDGERH